MSTCSHASTGSVPFKKGAGLIHYGHNLQQRYYGSNTFGRYIHRCRFFYAVCQVWYNRLSLYIARFPIFFFSTGYIEDGQTIP